MKLDMHLHSNHSSDGKASPRDLLKRAKKIGLAGLCITDHNTLRGSFEARKIAPEFGLIIVRGMEISSSQGHILGMGIESEVPKGLSPEETVARIREQGGIAVIPHPYRPWTGLGTDVTRSIKPDAIETMNSHSSANDNRLARKLCEDMRLPMTAGSDGHELGMVGKTWTIVPNASDEEGVLEAIRRGHTKVDGQNRNFPGVLKDRTLTVTQWIGRGFKKM